MYANTQHSPPPTYLHIQLTVETKVAGTEEASTQAIEGEDNSNGPADWLTELNSTDEEPEKADDTVLVQEPSAAGISTCAHARTHAHTLHLSAYMLRW